MREGSKVEELLQALDLSEAHKEACRKSFEKLRPVYHNELHCYSTAVTFYELATQAALELADVRHGFIAALYHDARHLMAADDDRNIASAVEWLKSAPLKFEDSLSLEAVCRLVQGTHNQRVAFTDKVEEVLHDADLLQTVKGTVRENRKWQKWLAEETGKPVTQAASLAFVGPRLLTAQAKAIVERTKSAF